MPPDGEPNLSSTPCTQRTVASADGLARVQAHDLEASIEAAALLVNVAKGQPHSNQVPESEAEGEAEAEYGEEANNENTIKIHNN